MAGISDGLLDAVDEEVRRIAGSFRESGTYRIKANPDGSEFDV